ncbi:MAG: hypothetical protein FRX49_09236 [Trebouxia sp. A1-2]|nr:MAG: hypothetical protein FRX49_09236 [Trebouxia sp. A1-2]
MQAPIISTPSAQPHESPLEVQRLFARMAGFSVEQDAWHDWVPQVRKGKWQHASRGHKAEAPFFCKGKACLAAAMGS